MRQQFGEYETVRQRWIAPERSVWVARPSGHGRGERFAIKVYKPAHSGDPLVNNKAFADFVERAKLQREAADKSRLWAPIHESGLLPDGAYYVTDHYPSSLEITLDHGRQLTPGEIWAFLNGAACALFALDANCGRSHGNLKPANVLIAGRRPKRGNVVLTDPCADRPSTPENVAADLRVLGELLYGAVFGRRSKPTVWPIEESPEWKRFGRQANAWRSLCNLLLSPEGEDWDKSLSGVLDRLGSLQPKGEFIKPAARAAAAAVVLLAVGAGAWFWLGHARHAGGTLPTAANWQQQHAHSPIEAAYIQQIRQGLAHIDAAAHPVLTTFADQVRAALDSPAPVTTTRLKELAELTDRLAALTPKVDWHAVKAEQPSQLTVHPGVTIDRDEVEGWLETLALYQLPADTDPRPAAKPQWDAAVAALDLSLASVRDADLRDDLAGRISHLKASLQRLLAYRWISRDRKSIADAVPAVNAELGALHRAVISAAQSWDKQLAALAQLQRRMDGAPVTAVKNAWKSAWEAADQAVKSGHSSPARELARLEQLALQFEQMQKAFPEKPPYAGNRQWTEPLGRLLRDRREAALTAAVNTLGQSAATTRPADVPWKSQQQSYAADVARADTLHANLAALEKTLDEQAMLSPELAKRYLSECTPILKDSEFAAAVAPVTTRIDRLLALAKADRATLARAIEDPHYEVLLAAWRRLDDPALGPWPATLDDFKLELAAQKSLAAHKELADECARTAAHRWNKLVSTLPAAQAEAAARFWREHVQTLVPLEQTPRWFAYNVALEQLKRDRPTDGQTAPRIASLKDVARRLEVAADKPVAAVLQAVDQIRPFSGRLDLTTAGPGAVGWHFRDVGGALIYAYRAPGEVVPVSLEFLRVDPRSPDLSPFYISTTEVPLKMFMTVASDPRNRAAFLTMLAGAAELHDRRIQGWQWRATMVETDQILTKQVFGADVADGAVQAIPPNAAMLWAALAGCRLPTSAEWRSASAAYRPPGGWWLRDAAFDNTWGAKGKNFATDAFIFGADQIPPPRDNWSNWTGEPKLPDHAMETSRDGLLFAKLPAAPTKALYHMVGNVAEYTFEDADAFQQLVMEQLPREHPRNESWLSAPELDKWLAQHPSGLCVIGGSAMSPPQLGFDVAQPVTFEAARNGFSDVGFRVAFTAPDVPVAAQFVRAMRHAQYLAAPMTDARAAVDSTPRAAP